MNYLEKQVRARQNNVGCTYRELEEMLKNMPEELKDDIAVATCEDTFIPFPIHNLTVVNSSYISSAAFVIRAGNHINGDSE